MKLPSTPGLRPTQQMQPPFYARNRMPAVLSATAVMVFAMAARPASLHAQDPASPPGTSPGSILARRPGRFSNLPATQPTSLPATAVQPTSATLPAASLPTPNDLPAPLSATPVATDQPITRPHRAQVSFVDGQLNVRAADSSLNQILRAISRATGLNISGGVADQRVFGNYGPASLSSVLATLLDGTGTNILLLEGDAQTPPELILTVRGGGPTPPNPSAPGFDDGPDPVAAESGNILPAQAAQLRVAPQQQPQPAAAASTDATSGPRSMPQPENNVNGSPNNTSPTAATLPTTDSVPTDSLPVPSTTPSTSGIVDAPNPPAPGSTTGTNPNGSAPTPEQIYQQLLQMQKQQKTNPPATSTTTPQP